jgi:hypothetical protein
MYQTVVWHVVIAQYVYSKTHEYCHVHLNNNHLADLILLSKFQDNKYLK